MSEETKLSALSVFDRPGFNALRTMLGIAQMKTQVSVANIANASTEGYSPRRVAFETILAEQTGLYGNTPQLKIENIHIQIPEPNRSVVVEEEVALMNLNQVHHQALLSMVNSQLELYNMAISDGRR